MIPFPRGETVTRLRGTLVADPYSGDNTKVDWTNPSQLAIEGCGVADGGSLEPVQNARNAVESDYDVLAPFGSDVRAGDRLVIPRGGGLTCEVQGRPFDWYQPQTGWRAGMVIKAKMVEG